MPRSPRLLWLLALAGLLAGSTADAQPLAGFRAGESFVFNFSVGTIQAGRARLAVGAPRMTAAGQRVAIQGDAESASWLQLLAKVHDTYHAQLEGDGVPATRRVQIEEHGMRERAMDFALERHAKSSLLHLDLSQGKARRNESHLLPAEPFDLVGSLFFVRFQRLGVGDAFEFVFFDGPIFYRASARVLGRERLERAGNTVSALRVDVNAVRIDWGFHTMGGNNPERRHASLLVSDDADHVPYRIEGDTDFGKCELELVSYLPGKPPAPLALPLAPTPRVVLRPDPPR